MQETPIYDAMVREHGQPGETKPNRPKTGKGKGKGKGKGE